jgi:glucose/arabinose dehydrogenase
VLAGVVVLAAIVLVVVVATRPRSNSGVGVGGPTGRPSAASSPGSSGAAGSGAPGSPASPASPGSAGPAFNPTGVAVTLEVVVDGLDAPLAIVNAGDGSGRLFVAEQGGRIRIVRNGQVEPAVFLDIGAQISSGGERGLLGLAFHPRYPDDPRVFVDYTDREGDTRVSSFTLDPADPDRLDPGSEVNLLHIAQPFANHNGGAVVFDQDGFLLVAMGDGGSGGDPQGNGQSLTTLLGKILRIDIDQGADQAAGRLYGIPADNPFADGGAERRPEIWLSGLRNPWRMSVDRATGDLWLGDVGQNAWEEIDVQRVAAAGGTNFGWNRMEGTHCFEPEQGCEDPSLVLPVSDYGHDLGCTVIGGNVYRGTAQAALVGGYVFGDYCSGRLFAIDAASDAYQSPVEVARTDRNLSAFGEDEAGELYVTDIGGGELLRVVATVP